LKRKPEELEFTTLILKVLAQNPVSTVCFKTQYVTVAGLKSEFPPDMQLPNSCMSGAEHKNLKLITFNIVKSLNISLYF
jgi:hypothetical protein